MNQDCETYREQNCRFIRSQMLQSFSLPLYSNIKVHRKKILFSLTKTNAFLVFGVFS